MQAEQNQVELWPYLLSGVLTVIGVVLAVGLAIYSARQYGRAVATFNIARSALFVLALLALGYAVVAGPLVLLALVVTPLFAGAMVAMALYRRSADDRAPSHSEGGEHSGLGVASAGKKPRAGPWFVPVWFLASLVGSAAGGVGLIFPFFGLLVLFGALVGSVQALALFPYLKGAGVWAVASFLGWVCGSMVGAFDYTWLPGQVAAMSFVPAAGWVGLAVAQGLALLLMVFSSSPASRRHQPWLRRPVLVWFPAAGVGGVLAAVAQSLVGTRLDAASAALGQSRNNLLYELAPSIVGGMAAGAVYGIVTAPVLVWLLRALARAVPSASEASDAST